jgi:hypothetical protein
MNKDLKTTTYKSVGYKGYTTIFLPTNKRVQEEYENGKEGDQLWQQLNDDGLLCGNMWTEIEIIGCGAAFEIPNPRDGYNQLITDFHNQLFEVEADLEKLHGLKILTINNQSHRARLIGEKKALESVIIKLKKSK